MSLTIHLGDCLNGCATCTTNHHEGKEVCETCGLDVTPDLFTCLCCLDDFGIDGGVLVIQGETFMEFTCHKCEKEIHHHGEEVIVNFFGTPN